MPEQSKIEIIKTRCGRCGAPVSMLSESLFGIDELYKELGPVCRDCITPEEDSRIVGAILDAVRRDAVQEVDG